MLFSQKDLIAFPISTLLKHASSPNNVHYTFPQLFLKNVDVFLKDVSSENDICLFLADLM